MTWIKTRTANRATNMSAQAIAEAAIRRNNAIVVRLKGGEYTFANKPLGKSILDNVKNQIINTGIFG